MTPRTHARAALLAILDCPGGCEYCHLHYPFRDGSGKHATVEVATDCEGKWNAYVHLWRATPTIEDPSKHERVKQELRTGHATAAEAIAAIFDGPSALWPQPKEGGKEVKA